MQREATGPRCHGGTICADSMQQEVGQFVGMGNSVHLENF